MKRLLLLCLGTGLLLLSGLGVWAQVSSVNPPTGSIWTYFGPTFGAGWGPSSSTSPTVFVCDTTGATDCTEALRLAVAATPCYIHIPAGTYKISGNIPITQPCTITGAGSGLTVLSVAVATGDIFTLSGTSLTPRTAITFRDFSMASAVVRTGGAYIHCVSPNCMLSDLVMRGAAIGIIFNQYATTSVAKNISFRNTVASSVYSKSTGILLTGSVEAVTLDNIFSDVDNATANNTPRSCIELQSADATIIITPHLIHCQSNILVNPSLPGHNVLSTQVIGGFLDSPLAPAGSNAFALELISIAGAITRFTANGTWFGSSTHDGINFAAPGGVASGFICTGCHLVLNARHGANISSQNFNDIRFIGGAAVANGGPVFTGGANFSGVVNAHNITINGVAQSQFGENPSKAGVIMAPGSAKWIIVNNDFTGVETPIVSPENCADNCLISGNPGYNPVHARTLVFGPSPAAICTIATPETLYISGGVVSKIEVQQWSGNANTGLTSGSFALAANACLIVTYTTMPTGVRDVH